MTKADSLADCTPLRGEHVLALFLTEVNVKFANPPTNEKRAPVADEIFLTLLTKRKPRNMVL
jgi:hypothetical protein